MAKNKKTGSGGFHLEFKNDSQKIAYTAFEGHDILFLLGPAGTGKTFLATAFAIQEVLKSAKKKIVITRPILEAGKDRMGYLPGDIKEKTDPYMRPIYDCIAKLCGASSSHRQVVEAAVEVAPIAYMRGRTFEDSICILDEAQNCTKMELKLFLTRLGPNSKIIISGDLSQYDTPLSGLKEVVDALAKVKGISVIDFPESAIVRHPLVREIIKLI